MESDLVQRENVDSDVLQRKILDCLPARQGSIKTIDLLDKLRKEGYDRPLPIGDVQKVLRKLEEDKKIVTIELSTKDSFLHYLARDYAAPFFWVCTISTAVFLVAVYLVIDSFGFWSGVFRATACGLYMVIIPGSAFVKLLLSSRGYKDLFEQTILAIAFSLVLVLFAGMIIYYSYRLNTYGIDLVILIISAMTIINSITAKYREFRNRITNNRDYQGID